MTSHSWVRGRVINHLDFGAQFGLLPVRVKTRLVLPLRIRCNGPKSGCAALLITFKRSSTCPQ